MEVTRVPLVVRAPPVGNPCSILTTCPYFDNLEFHILMQVVFSDTLFRLLPLQSGFERFQYI